MRTRTSLVAAIAMCICSSTVGASAAAVTVDGSYVKPYTNLWKTTTSRDGVDQDSGTWSDSVTAITVDGKPAWRRTQVVTLPKGGSFTYVNVFEPKTLRPISNAAVVSNGDYSSHRFAPDGHSMTTFDARGDHRALPVETMSPLAEPVFDYNGGMYGLILRGFPLAVGLRGTVATVDFNNDAILHVPFRVVGRERTEAKPGTFVMTWVVDADFLTADHSEDGSIFRFYLSDEAPFVIKLVFTDPNKKLVQTYTMV